MASSLYQQLQPSQASNNPMNLIQAVRTSQNPRQMLMNLAGNNSQVASILREVQNCGGDARTLFYRKAQQMGVDPNAILNQLR